MFAWLKLSLGPTAKSSGENWEMIDVEAIPRLNNYNTEVMIRVLELVGDRLYAWLVLGSPKVVRKNLDGAHEYVMALRKMVRNQRPDHMSPEEATLPI